MHRSGSTLVWQIARHLVKDQPGLRNPRGLSTSQFPAAANDPEDLLMAKVHFRPAMEKDDFPQAGAKYLYTYRDIRDVVASLYRKGRAKPEDPERGARNSRLSARREIRGDAFWRSRDDVFIRKYEDFRDDIPGLVRDLADFLGIGVTTDRVSEIVADVDMQAQEQRAIAAKQHGVDDDLRVTSNHITDGREGAWRETLTPEELAAIEGESARWLVEHGYDVYTQVGLRKTIDLRSATLDKHVGDLNEHGWASATIADDPNDREPLSAQQVRELILPYVVATAVASITATVARSRNPTASTLLWMAASASAGCGAYLLGQNRIRPRAALAAILRRSAEPRT